MSNSVQIKARQMVVDFYNSRPVEGPHKKPIDIKDVRILFWRSVISENTWNVVLWVRDPEPTFYTVEHDKVTNKSKIVGYFIGEIATIEPEKKEK